MEFRFETAYTPVSLTAMARAIRKTVRKKHSKRSHIFGVLTAMLGLSFVFSASEWNFQLSVTLLLVVVILSAMLFEDRLNGYIAFKRMPPGMDHSVTCFREDGYHSQTALGNSDFPYSTIRVIAEDANYFVFIFSASHAQIYNKQTLSGGSCKDFADFIQAKTGLEIQAV